MLYTGARKSADFLTFFFLFADETEFRDVIAKTIRNSVGFGKYLSLLRNRVV